MDKKYQMSFTAGGLLYLEAIRLAGVYRDLRDWNAVRDRALAENLLQARTGASAVRYCRETIQRLRVLEEDELALLVKGNHQEQEQILWLAACKKYGFIHDFAVEVLREKYLSMQQELTYDDFDAFFNAKVEWHEELEKLTEKTVHKVRQVLFRMMHEAELVSEANIIQSGIYSEALIRVIYHDSPSLVTIFPISDNDIQRMVS